MPPSKPLVLLIDLDGTLQGDILPQIQEYDLVQSINRNIMNVPKIRYNVRSLYGDFADGLLRPFVAESLRAIKTRHPHVEMYVYTASSHAWARYIVPRLEMAAFGGTFFNRPIFTRRWVSPEGVKSIRGVKPAVERSLEKKYGRAIKGSEYPIYLIDDNDVLLPEERHHLVRCPAYEYIRVIDPLRNVKESVLSANAQVVYDFFNVPAAKRTSVVTARRHIYQTVYTLVHENTMVKNIAAKHDNYWERVKTILLASNLRTPSEITAAFDALKEMGFDLMTRSEEEA